jgi:signal transduction histidine kinase
VAAWCPALERLAQSTTTNDLRVEFVTVVTDGTRLSPAVETATYRTVQEAIANAVNTPTPAPSASASSSTKTTWYH